MKRTSTISLGGMNFTIDDDAYDVLNQYFLALSKRFPEDEKEEILRDIESRMAELFTFKLQTRNVIDINDVNEVIDKDIEKWFYGMQFEDLITDDDFRNDIINGTKQLIEQGY